MPWAAAGEPAIGGVLAPTIGLMPALHGRTAPGRAAIVESLVVTSPAGWLPAVDLVSGGGLERLLWIKARSLRVSPYVAALLTWKAYSYWLVLPAVAGYLSSRRIPVLSAGNVLVRVSRREPRAVLGMRQAWAFVPAGDAAAGTPGTRTVADESALLRAMRETIVDRHLRPLAVATRALTRVGERPLWGSLANAVARLMERAPGLRGAEVLATADTMLRALGVADLVSLELTKDGACRTRRRTCCLAFTVAGREPCATCVLRWSQRHAWPEKSTRNGGGMPPS